MCDISDLFSQSDLTNSPVCFFFFIFSIAARSFYLYDSPWSGSFGVFARWGSALPKHFQHFPKFSDCQNVPRKNLKY